MQILSTTLIQHAFLPRLPPEVMSQTMVHCLWVLSPAPLLLCSVSRAVASAGDPPGCVSPHRPPAAAPHPHNSHLCLANSKYTAGTSGKKPTYQCRRCKRYRFYHWVGKIPWRRAWQPTPVFLPGKSHRQRSLVGYAPWGHKDSDTTE